MNKIVIMCAMVLISFASQSQITGLSCALPEQAEVSFDASLTELNKKAREAGQVICENYLQVLPEEQQAVGMRLDAFTLEVENTVNELFSEQLFPGLSSRIGLWSRNLHANTDDYRYLQFLEDGNTAKGDDFTPYWEVWDKNNDQLSRLSFELNDDRMQSCAEAIAGVQSCEDVFAQIRRAAAPFQTQVSQYMLEQNGEKLAQMQNDWNMFIEQARYQTPLDVWLTTLIYRNDYQGIDLAGPPSTQYFLLRPSLVFEHIGNAPDGSKDDLSLAVEWVGVNWWRKGIGLSITSTYRDAAQVSSVGTGITVHINNRYSIGVTHRGSNDNAIFLNIDLLELFGEKKAVYQAYKDDLKLF
ncbi:hypothetical protein KJ365_14275 [Glaciecola sp. XM2]|jgi:hypothetical protein|uniref:hypothetical protein n=1 Tax=Glaciecola sp. XM2 TaxID=1914931 RepID=UPI001BDDE9FE|nr:hypothetical protein [Glaciecola sp. XM2]MBT1452056.1 hypothetical protein [Glaciecola sp. XM2]